MIALSHVEEHIADEFAPKRAVGERVQQLVGRSERHKCVAGSSNRIGAVNSTAATMLVMLVRLILMLRQVLMMILLLMLLFLLFLLQPMAVSSGARGIAPREHATLAGIHKAHRGLADAALLPVVVVTMRQRDGGRSGRRSREMARR